MEKHETCRGKFEFGKKKKNPSFDSFEQCNFINLWKSQIKNKKSKAHLFFVIESPNFIFYSVSHNVTLN